MHGNYNQSPRRERRWMGLLCVLLLCSGIAGCGDEPEPPPVDTGPTMVVSENLSGNSRYVWEREPRPYVVRSLQMSEKPTSQRRIASVVVEHPQSKAEVREVIAEIFDGFWEDITSFGAAEVQRIQVLVFCCEDDAIDNDGFHIMEATGGGLDSDLLPKFAQCDITWQWRNPDDKPDDETLAVFRDYWNGRQAIVGDDPAEEARLVETIAATRGIPVTDVAEKVGVCWVWRNCQELNERRKADQKNWFLKRWGFAD